MHPPPSGQAGRISNHTLKSLAASVFRSVSTSIESAVTSSLLNSLPLRLVIQFGATQTSSEEFPALDPVVANTRRPAPLICPVQLHSPFPVFVPPRFQSAWITNKPLQHCSISQRPSAVVLTYPDASQLDAITGLSYPWTSGGCPPLCRVIQISPQTPDASLRPHKPTCQGCVRLLPAAHT